MKGTMADNLLRPENNRLGDGQFTWGHFSAIGVAGIKITSFMRQE